MSYQIAIDGPSGAGKSTVAKLVAKELGITYIDTGAMYRALGLKMKRLGIPMIMDGRLKDMLYSTEIDFSDGKVMLDGEDVSGLIRTPEISRLASDVSAFKDVRVRLVEIQQALAGRKSVIMEGRDICNVVLKNAKYKYFVTASPEERAHRRVEELKLKGEVADYDDILKKINERDYNDSHRDVDPLHKEDDTMLLDTTNMTIDQVVNFIVSKVKEN